MPTLRAHLALIAAEYADALAHPLAARQAMLVAVLLDKFADRVFAAHRNTPARVFGAEDAPAFRAALRARSPALKTLFDLCGIPPTGTRLEVAAHKVPIPDYPSLPVEDFMVSLYNGNTVQRVVLTAPDGTRALAHDVLADALAWWQATDLAE